MPYARPILSQPMRTFKPDNVMLKPQDDPDTHKETTGFNYV